MKPPTANDDFSWLVYADYLQDNDGDGNAVRREVEGGSANVWIQNWIDPRFRNTVGNEGVYDDLRTPFLFAVRVGGGKEGVGASVGEVAAPLSTSNNPGCC